MDLDENTLALVLGFATTPRDAARLAGVNKSLRSAERSAHYSAICVDAGSAAELRWLRARASRVARLEIACFAAAFEDVCDAYVLAREMPDCELHLEMGSLLFEDISETLSRNGAAMIALLKQHVRAPRTGDSVRALEARMREEYGCDMGYDAGVSLAWTTRNESFSAGDMGQLYLELHLSQDSWSSCKMRIEVWRSIPHHGGRDSMGRDENDSYFGVDDRPLLISDDVAVSDGTSEFDGVDWWLVAAQLFKQVQTFEFMPREDTEEEEDGEEDGEDSESDGDEDDPVPF